MDSNKDVFTGHDAFIKCHTEQDGGIIAAGGYTSSETAKSEAVGCTRLKMGLVLLT